MRPGPPKRHGPGPWGIAASPLVVGDHLLIQNAYAGETLVLKPGDKLEIFRRNTLGAEVDEIRSPHRSA